MSFKEIIKKARPHLAESTLTTYNSILTNLAKKMGVEPSKEFYEKHADKVMSHLKDMPANKRKTVLASLVVLTGSGAAADKYRDQMMKDAGKYSEELKSQDMSQKQKDNWMSQDEVNAKFQSLYKDNYHLFNKPSLDNAEKKRLLDLVLVALYTLVPPRRSLDYTAMKLKNIDKETDNYIDGRKLVFNTYKTKSKYGKQVVSMPPKLAILLKKWSKVQDSDYLLGENGKPMTVPKLTMRLNRIFGKKISSTMLRKIFLTDKYKDIPALKQISQLENDMGNSFQVQLSNYVKPDKSPDQGSKEK